LKIIFIFSISKKQKNVNDKPFEKNIEKYFQKLLKIIFIYDRIYLKHKKIYGNIFQIKRRVLKCWILK